jgi:hypothetical protein
MSSRLLSWSIKVKMHKATILAVVWYRYETWSLRLREERSLRLFENRLLRRIFGQKFHVVKGEWTKVRKEWLHNLYSTPNIFRKIKSRKMNWARTVARMGKERNV